VLVLTAGVGGGHEAAGRNVGAELEAAGYEVEGRDGLLAMGPHLNRALTAGYRNQARHMPASLGAIFAVTCHPAGAAAIRRAVGLLHARRLGKTIREVGPDAVISTYPLVTAALGRLRRGGSLEVPAIALIPDYGVHPLWVSPGLDLHLVASPESARLAAAAGGRAMPVRMPVAAGFGDAPDCGVARATLGLPADAFVALLVGGVWGIGDLEGAAACALEAGAHAVVVTGENAQLKRRLEQRFAEQPAARILGWRDDMPTLMAAADCLVQNAGGMTCLEAIEVGLPIVLFDPIRGHGELNAMVMEEEGVARVARTPEDLRRLLRTEVRRESTGDRKEREAARMPARIPALLPALLSDGAEREVPRRRYRLRRSRLRRSALARGAVVGLISWSLFVSSVTAVGAGRGDRAAQGRRSVEQ
jgi:UDP-N-acetylglucosamine:LPS N-acetylglucosamine transferase